MSLFTMFSSMLNAASSVAETAESVNSGINLEFEPHRFIDMLPYMGKGMLVIFVIIAVIIVATVIINKSFSKKKDEK